MASPATFTEIHGSPFHGRDAIQASEMAFDPEGTLLAVSNTASNNVSVFSVDAPTGTMTELPGSPLHGRNAIQASEVQFNPEGNAARGRQP